MFGAGLAQTAKMALTARSGSTRDPLARQACQRRHEASRGLDRAPNCPECWRSVGRHLLRGDEQVGGAVRMGDDIGQRHRRAFNIVPRMLSSQAIESSAVITAASRSLLGQPFGNGGALGFAGLAGQFVRVDQCRGGRGCGPVLPDRVDRIAVHRDQLASRLLASALSAACAQFAPCSQAS